MQNGDDSTVHGRYTLSRQEAGLIVQSKRQILLSELDDTLTRVSYWGQANLVEFNIQKTQVCVISSKKSINTSHVSFLGSKTIK